jgi:hypothetical protein
MSNLLLLVLVSPTVSKCPWFHILWVLIHDETSQYKVLDVFPQFINIKSRTYHIQQGDELFAQLTTEVLRHERSFITGS